MKRMKELPQEVILILAALLAGIASYAQNYINTKTFKLLEFISHMFVALFAAYVFTTFAHVFTSDYNNIQLANALGAFTGVKGIGWIQEWFKRKFL